MSENSYHSFSLLYCVHKYPRVLQNCDCLISQKRWAFQTIDSLVMLEVGGGTGKYLPKWEGTLRLKNEVSPLHTIYGNIYPG